MDFLRSRAAPGASGTLPQAAPGAPEPSQGRLRSPRNPPQTPSRPRCSSLFEGLLMFFIPVPILIPVPIPIPILSSRPRETTRPSEEDFKFYNVFGFLLYSFPLLPLCKPSGNIPVKIRLTNRPSLTRHWGGGVRRRRPSIRRLSLVLEPWRVKLHIQISGYGGACPSLPPRARRLRRRPLHFISKIAFGGTDLRGNSFQKNV